MKREVGFYANKREIPPTRRWAYDRYKGYEFHDLRNLYCAKYVNEETASTEKIT